MEEKENFTFEEIFKQNKNRIHYQIHNLSIRDPHNEYFVEGIYAMWMAYKKYQPNKGPMATYFNYMIRNRLVDKIRNSRHEENVLQKYTLEERVKSCDGNRNVNTKELILNSEGITIDEQDLFWTKVKSSLTDRQWKWVYYAIILELPQKEIAKQEGVSVETVKGWAKEARRKLRKELILEDFLNK